MKTNLKHIDETFLYENDFKDPSSLEKWLETIQVSTKSSFRDNFWEFDAPDIYKMVYKSISFDKPTDGGHKLSDYPNLCENIKRVIFFMQTTIETRRKKKFLSQVSTFRYFMSLVDWLVNNNIKKFSDFSKQNLNQYIDFLKSKKQEKSIKHYLYPIRYVYQYREYLVDVFKDDVFSELDLSTFDKASRENREKTKAIPNHILEEMCAKLMPIIDYFYENKFDLNTLNKQAMIKNDNIHNHNYVIPKLNAIGYFMIGLYTGMRLSEIVSIKKSGVKVDENNVVVLNSKLYKTVGHNDGRPENWGCGINNENNYALKIIKILSRLTPENHEDLFFIYHQKKVKKLNMNEINGYLQKLANFCYVDWDISSHQLRKTFARLIGITDKTCLLALKEHFKHASLAMTDYYVGSNFELLGMINEEKQLEITEGLESIFSSDKLAGKLGEKISKSNLKFRGNVEARKEYINELLNNSDLIVVPHEYGFCIYQPEQAKCKGENKNIGLNTCKNCNNFAVSEKHKVFWVNRVEQYENFKEQIINIPKQQTTIEELNFEINEAKDIINKINQEK